MSLKMITVIRKKMHFPINNTFVLPVTLAYIDTQELPTDENYDCMIDEIINPRAMLCDRDDAVLGDVSRPDMIKWPKGSVISVAERQFKFSI
ncbi:hypothetical protein MKW98_020084 [Papaver atlanticum]|uniref:Uncharacterized protein n=1 Tax=Papaver atlanticum TaxID=357466 RepID=A0AAD4S2A7_9MAGN|nr:hypothetical protein MKW98_020084 [Papaver atlanticum]